MQLITEFGWPEEVVLLISLQGSEAPRRCLYIGDAICGGRDDIGVPVGEVGQYTLMGRSLEKIATLIPDVPNTHRAIERLLQHEFDVLAFEHGEPVIRNPHEALRRFLARDDIWRAGSPE